MDIQLLEKVSACALNRLLGNKPAAAHQILESLGNCRDFFHLSEKDRTQILASLKCNGSAVSPSALEDSAKELESLQARGCTFIHCGQDCYPHLLRDCTDAPLGLYVKSATPPEKLFNAYRNVSIVGTRDISLYGKEWCERIVRELASASERCCIVSGLAFGVDITAHRTALSQGLPTIAVLPTGIDCVYPQYHTRAAAEIASTEGCALITDFPPGTTPQPFTFLRRNRIIAGLSADTLLIESKKNGGGMLTARLAFEYGRNVYCLPGRIDDLRSEGCNLLVSSKVADPIVNLDQLRKELGLWKRKAPAGTAFEQKISSFYGKLLPAGTIALLCKIYGLIQYSRGISPEQIAQKSGLPYRQVSPLVQRLESDGFICSDVLGRCTINGKLL